MMGGGAIRTKNYDEALKNFTKSAELAELYGDMSQMAKANGWVAKIYQIQGGDAFNNKDYATAAGVFEKGYTGGNGRTDKKSTGIGLYLCRRICRSLGHTIRASSVPNQGTEIRIGLGQKKTLPE